MTNLCCFLLTISFHQLRFTLKSRTNQSAQQSSHQVRHYIMAALVCFNIGGKRYTVPCSILNNHPTTLLAQLALEHLQVDPSGEICMERNGDQFQYVLDYLKHNGLVVLPLIVSKEDFLAELEYFRVTDVDKTKIVHYVGGTSQSIEFAKAKMQAKVSSWILDRAIVALAHECASSYLKHGFHKRITIRGPEIIELSQNDSPIIMDCSLQTWMELLSLLFNNEMRLLPQAQEKCNQYLHTVTLEIICAKLILGRNVIQVTMKHITVN